LRADVATLQINVGKLCNQACEHCHVDAGPNRTESMSEKVAERSGCFPPARPSLLSTSPAARRS
jgi:hypothetical protein